MRPLLSDNGNVIEQAEDMANIFAASFSSVYLQGIPERPEPPRTFDGSIGYILVIITLDSVMTVLSHLFVLSSMGPDELHPCLLKSYQAELSHPLWLIFRASLDICTLPSMWQRSFIVPIFTKGTRHNPL